MRFNYTQGEAGLVSAAKYANELLDRQEFWEMVIRSGPYDYSNVPAPEIAQHMRNYTGSCEIRVFRGVFRFRKTVAYVDATRENIIFMNKRFLGNTIAQKVNTLVHEYVHMTDYFGDENSAIEYGHGSQSASGKGNSAPYAIGQIAEEFYKSEHPDFIKRYSPRALSFECDLGELPDELILDND